MNFCKIAVGQQMTHFVFVLVYSLFELNKRIRSTRTHAGKARANRKALHCLCLRVEASGLIVRAAGSSLCACICVYVRVCVCMCLWLYLNLV